MLIKRCQMIVLVQTFDNYNTSTIFMSINDTPLLNKHHGMVFDHFNEQYSSNTRHQIEKTSS